MKKLVALLLALICLFGSAISESAATPTDLEEIDDDDWGYIDIKFERKVYVSISGLPQYGDTVILTAVLVDFLPDDIVTFQWQYALDKDSTDWILIEDATEQVYTFILDDINIHYWYRVIVKLEGIE